MTMFKTPFVDRLLLVGTAVVVSVIVARSSMSAVPSPAPASGGNNAYFNDIDLFDFETVGMPFPNNKGTIVFAHLENLHDVSVNDNQNYMLYESDKTGAQVWSHSTGIAPHYHGKSKGKLLVVSKQDGPTRSAANIALGGSFMAVTQPTIRAVTKSSGQKQHVPLDKKKGEQHQGDVNLRQIVVTTLDKKEEYEATGVGFVNPDTEDVYLTFHFDCPNYGFFVSQQEEQPSLPTFLTIQTTVFARVVWTYESVTVFKESEKLLPFRSQFFGPENWMKNNKEKTSGMFIGHVVETELKTNELTGELFYWALIQTTGDVEMDVVIHPSLLESSRASKPPRVGGVLQVFGRLSGLLLLEDGGDEESVNYGFSFM